MTFAIRDEGQAQAIGDRPFPRSRDLSRPERFLSGRSARFASVLERPASRSRISDYREDELRALWRAKRREAGE